MNGNILLSPGPLRQRMRRYVCEGHNIESANDMKLALDQHGGVKSVQSATATYEAITVKLPKWLGIQSLMNFQ
jgi:hypothetical protein